MFDEGYEGMDLNSFLDQAYEQAKNDLEVGRSVVPRSATYRPDTLLHNINIGKKKFIEHNGFKPAAVLLHPVDKFKIQQWAQEDAGLNFFEHPEHAPDMAFELALQPAVWVEEGMYQIISKRDYEMLVTRSGEADLQ